MTDTGEAIRLSPAARKFVLHWGEMGSRWGINRTVAQIHALLFIAPRPLPADEIATTLAVARSNVSTSLKDLQAWGIIRSVPRLGDRRDHYESLKDVWTMFQIILDERKKREIDPTIALLRECLAETETPPSHPSHAPHTPFSHPDPTRPPPTVEEPTRQRLEELLDFFETMSTWYLQIRSMPRVAVIRFVRMGRQVRQLLGA